MGLPAGSSGSPAAAVPGAYLRVLVPGEVDAGDPVVVEDRPDSPATIGAAPSGRSPSSRTCCRAWSTPPHLLPRHAQPWPPPGADACSPYAGAVTSPAERLRRPGGGAERPALTDFTAGYPFELDPFQTEACEALEDGLGVLVCAPTGAGKTVVGEFAVHLALAEGRKCFYTTPIKALSNQKYNDLVDRYGPATSACSPATTRSTATRRWW